MVNEFKRNQLFCQGKSYKNFKKGSYGSLFKAAKGLSYEKRQTRRPVFKHALI